MSERPPLPAECASFDASVAELAFALLEPAERDPLLRHAEFCERCRQELLSLTSAADRVLVFAPEAEPPVGFEVRALEDVPPIAVPTPLTISARSSVIDGSTRRSSAATSQRVATTHRSMRAP